MEIRTNNQPRLMLDWNELPSKMKDEFDELLGNDAIDADFVKYKNRYYFLGDFITTEYLPNDDPRKEWHGYYPDSFFSGVVVEFTEDEGEDYVILGEYFA